MKKKIASIHRAIRRIYDIILGVLGVSTKKRAASVTIIGGADGPTSIFLVGKIGFVSSVKMIIAGVSAIFLIVILFKRIVHNEM